MACSFFYPSMKGEFYETYEKTPVVTAFNAGDDLEPAADFGPRRVEDRLWYPDHD